MSNSEANDSTPPIATDQDKACAVLVREALFPLRKDWNAAKHHVSIHPAVTALDVIRNDLVTFHGTPFSNLFPRHVMLVPSTSSQQQQQKMQWNGQPDIGVDGRTVEVIPDVLSVKCQKCPIDSIQDGIKAYTKSTISSSNNNGKKGVELVVCSNALLLKDYQQFSTKENAQTLLEQRRDLPSKSLERVEETLAHELTKMRVNKNKNKDNNGAEQLILHNGNTDCHTYAQLELLAARAAECLYEEHHPSPTTNEIRKGSQLRPTIGFSLLPQSTKRSYISKCTQQVAIQNTSRVYGTVDGTQCVKDVVAKNMQ